MLSTMNAALRISLVTTFLSLPTAALAQYSIPKDAASSARIGSARQKVYKKLVREGGWELGGSINFITSTEDLGNGELEFTDLVVARLHGLVSIGGKVELFGGTDLLPKKPSDADELAWQGGLIGARMAFGEHFAGWVRAAGGPQMGRTGWWSAGSGAGQFKMELEDVLFFEAQLGWAQTHLFFDESTDSNFYLAELFSQVGIAVRDRRGQFGAWLNFDYYVPILANPDEADGSTGAFLDPQPRVNLHVGVLLGISKTVDLFMEFSILDRGEVENPETTLPLLQTGFDQRQLLFGFMRRFGGLQRNK